MGNVGSGFIVAQHNGHSTIGPGAGLIKNFYVGVLVFKNGRYAIVNWPAAVFLCKYHGRRAVFYQLNSWYGVSEYGPRVQLEFVKVLRIGQGHHAGIVRPWRKLAK